MYGRKPVQLSQSLVPVTRPRSSSRDFSSPTLLGGLCGTEFGSPFAFGASPLAFGIPALAGTVSSGFCGPALVPPGPPRLLPSPGHRYNFPAQDSSSSIWAPDYRFKEDGQDLPPAPLEFASMRPQPKTRTRPMKSICPSAVPTVGIDEEVDEDAILTGKSSLHRHKPEAGVPASRQTGNEDMFISENVRSRKPAAAREKQNTAPDQAAPQRNSRKTRRHLVRTSERKKKDDTPPTRGADAIAPLSPQHRGGPGADTKRGPPRRARKQDEQWHTGEASRSLARKQWPSRQHFVVEIAAMDGPRRDEYEEVDDAVKDIAGSADEDPKPESSPSSRLGQGTTGPGQLGVVSVSQHEPGPHNGTGAPEKTSEHRRKEPGKPHVTVSTAFCLSDDEMPIWPKPKRPRQAAKGHKELAAAVTSSGLPDSSIGNSAAASSPEESAAASSSEEAAGLPNVPDATTSPSSPQSETRRRPQAAVSLAELASLPSVEPPPLSTPSHDAAENGISATHVEGSSRRLTRELRWLRKLNGPGLATAHTRSSPSDGGPPQSRPTRRVASGSRRRAEESESADRQQDKRDGTPLEAVVEVSGSPPSNHVADTPTSQPAPSTQEHTALASPAEPVPQPRSPTSPSKPQTPRHRTVKPTTAPSSRRSILSLVDDEDDDHAADEKDLDELGRNLGGAPSAALVSSGASRKIWKSSERTTEVYHTPVKRRPTEVLSPGSIIKTPGGTLRACGLAGYRCGRDFCFTCL